MPIFKSKKLKYENKSLLSDKLTRKFKAEMAEVLGPDLMNEVEWRHGDADFQNVASEYYKIWERQEGGHKKYSYFALYDRLFAPYRNTGATLLEIGVYKGASIKSWQEFLGDGSTVVGVDVNPECVQWDDAAGRRHVRIGDQSNPDFLQRLGEEFGPFNIVVDDGSHITDHQIASFNGLFARHVAARGLYFIEDTNTSLWPAYRQGGKDIFDLVRALALATHIFYADHSIPDYGRDQHQKSFKTLAAAKLIKEVRVVDAGIAIYKAGDDHYPPLVDHR